MVDPDSSVEETEKPKRWRRRKDARPGEIIAAALEAFLERGFAATTMSSIAERAGVAKGSVYLHFPSKEVLFRTVILQLTGNDVSKIIALVDSEMPIVETLSHLIEAVARLLSTDPVPAVIRTIISDSREVPDVAAMWHDAVPKPVIGALSAAIARGQCGGEIVPGDPKIHALSLVGPLVMTTIFREVFANDANDLPSWQALAEQHAHTALRGILLG